VKIIVGLLSLGEEVGSGLFDDVGCNEIGGCGVGRD
jgi:hypothetical protein